MVNAALLSKVVDMSGLSISTIAHRTHTSTSTVKGWLSGSATPDLDDIMALKTCLHIPQNWLLQIFFSDSYVPVL